MAITLGAFVLLADPFAQSQTPRIHKTAKKLPGSPAPKQTITTKKKKKVDSQMSNATIEQPMQAYDIVDEELLSQNDLQEFFTIEPISNEIFSRIYKKSYKEDCTVPKEDLRYLRVLHVDGHGNTRIGELIVNKSIAKDIKTIFQKLYQKSYPIEKMVLVDAYDADDNASMADNNTSSFNYRVVEGTTHLSKHSLGLAIDINPRYNPYIHTLNGKVVCSPENGDAYQDRSKDFPYKIDTSDYAYQLFISYGFSWGGSWNSSKDYQHFQKD